jgi:amino-acid N-acetyltransferase
MEPDLDDVVGLLRGSGLSSDDLYAAGSTCWKVVGGGRLLGFCSLERSGDCGLLRSVAVREAARGRGVGTHLVEAAVAFARAQGLTSLYLFSKDTAAFFLALGWFDVPVREAAERLSAAPQVVRYNRVGWYANERALRLNITQ